MFVLNNAEAERGNEYEPKTTDNDRMKTWKNYDDGLTFYYQKHINFVQDKQLGIIIGDNKIPCDNAMFMHGGMIEPSCVEIILRHELDRRGL